MTRLATTLFTLLAVSGLAGPVHAATVFFDRAAWEAAVDDITEDPFDNAIAAGASITLDSGIQSTQLGTVRPNSNRVLGLQGQFDAEVGSFLVVTSIQWVLPQPVRAFGANVSVFANTHGLRGNFDGNGNQTFTLPSGVITNTFFGVIGDALFDTLTFVEIGGNTGVSFRVDDAAFATTVVPLPPAILLLAAPLLAMHRGARRTG